MSRKLMIRAVAISATGALAIGFVLQSLPPAAQYHAPLTVAASLLPQPDATQILADIALAPQPDTPPAAVLAITPETVVELAAFTPDDVPAFAPAATLPVPPGHTVVLAQAFSPRVLEALPEFALATGDVAQPAAAIFLAALDLVRTRPEGVPSVLPVQPVADRCVPQIDLVPMPSAMMTLYVHAPCNAGARLVLRYAGLALTVRTDADGMGSFSLPALEHDARVSIAFPDGTQHEARARVDGLAAYDRVAVQWQGNDAFALHAFEFGADFGAPGHVWAEAPATPEAEGGFLMRLGDASVHWPLMAEVYSFPAGHSAVAGVVELEVEAVVNAATCGREMLGEVLETYGGGPVSVSEVTLAMPDCDGPDGFLVLKNLLPTLTIAAN